MATSQQRSPPNSFGVTLEKRRKLIQRSQEPAEHFFHKAQLKRVWIQHDVAGFLEPVQWVLNYWLRGCLLTSFYTLFFWQPYQQVLPNNAVQQQQLAHGSFHFIIIAGVAGPPLLSKKLIYNTVTAGWRVSGEYI